jgi:hypothetical protein
MKYFERVPIKRLTFASEFLETRRYPAIFNPERIHRLT